MHAGQEELRKHIRVLRTDVKTERSSVRNDVVNRLERSISAMSVGQEKLGNRFLNQNRGQTGRWRLDAGEAVPCDHRRWGICDCREARQRGCLVRQCVLQVGSGRTIAVVKEALVELTGAADPEDLGVCRRCNGRVHPGTGYPAGLR
jgi:hypothetical protein